MFISAAMPSATSGTKKHSRFVLWAFAAVLVGYWVVTIYRLGGLWSALPEYSYGWAVPMLCVILFMDRWRTRGLATPVSASQPATFSAFSFQNFSIFLGGLAFVLARAAVEVMPTWRFAVWTLALSTVVLTLLLLRYFSVQPSVFQRFKASHFAFPVIFFLLAVPWPDRFEGPFIQTLTELNAALTVEVMALFKVVAVRMGNIILIEPGMVGVQEACSGIRSFQSTLMVALFLGELFRFSFWRRVVFVFFGAMLSFAFNIVRTSFLVWTCNRDGLESVDKFHDPAGWTILAASIAGLSMIGWWLYRQQRSANPSPPRSGRGQGEVSPLPASALDDSALQPARAARIPAAATSAKTQDRRTSVETPATDHRPLTTDGISAFSFQRYSILPLLFLLSVLIVTELGIRWWFTVHVRSVRDKVVDFGTGFDTGGANSKPLKVSREARGVLGYDRGGGWEWQGVRAERWQAFYFIWDEPKSLAREIVCTSGATVHQPELCFTLAGMQLRQVFGKKRYMANGVPLVFKVYEFADRNIPIFVFDCIWQRNTEQTTAEDQLKGDPSTGRGIRQAFRQFIRGERGITDEVRVFKLGVWGPRTIGEAEAAFQQQLNLLVQPVPSS